MNKLILLRHGQSQWNLENKFTGWTDVPLTKKGELEAKKAGELLKKHKILIDYVFSSVLERANKTAEIALKEAEIRLEEAEISLEEVEIKFQSQHDAAMKEFAAIQRILLKAPPGKSSSKSKPADFRIEEIGEVASQSIYASIENQFRGSEDFLLNQQRSYVKLIQGLPDKGTVVDLGCGRGEFLSLLSDHFFATQFFQPDLAMFSSQKSLLTANA